MKQGKIALPGQMWEYEAVEERVTRPDLGEYASWGLRVRTAEGAGPCTTFRWSAVLWNSWPGC